MHFRQMYLARGNKKLRWHRRNINTSSQNNSSSDEESNNNSHRYPQRQVTPPVVPSTTTASEGGSEQTRPNSMRNYNTELEQLVTELLTEIENQNETARALDADGVNVSTLVLIT